MPALHTSHSERARRRTSASPLRWFAVACVLYWPSHVFARDAAGAQTLFEQGRDRLRAGDIAEACPLLEESQRLDPANGTLLALAMCHEAQGKIASAWAEFAQVARLAKRDGQAEREAWATERLVALKPLLSLLDLRVPQPVRHLPELQLRLNGNPVQDNAWDTPLPVDGGEYRISVSAKGYRTWEHVVHVAPERANHVVVVPVLVREGSERSGDTTETAQTINPPLAIEAHLEPDAPVPQASDDELTSVQWLGVTSAGLGLAGWLLGVGAMYEALDKYNSANECVGWCRHQRQTEARSLGDWATGFGLGGTALVLAGGAMYLWGAPAKTVSPATAVSLELRSDKAGVLVSGEF